MISLKKTKRALPWLSDVGLSGAKSSYHTSRGRRSWATRSTDFVGSRPARSISLSPARPLP